MNNSTSAPESALEPSSREDGRRSLRWKRFKRLAIVLIAVFAMQNVLTLFGTLHAAARSGSVIGVGVQLVAGLGTNVNKQKGEYKDQPYTPMMLAAKNGHLNVVRLLAVFGGEVTERLPGWHLGGRCVSPLCLAVQNEHSEVARFLIERGALAPEGFPTVRDRDPLPYASSTGNLELVRMVVESGAIDLDYTTALLNAINACLYYEKSTDVHAGKNKFLETMRILCEMGANPNAAFLDETAIRIAIELENAAYIDLLLPFAIDRFQEDYSEYFSKEMDFVQLEESIETIRDIGWDEAFDQFEEQGLAKNPGTLAFLVFQAVSDTPAVLDLSPLHRAVHIRRPGVIKVFCEILDNVNIKTFRGESALHIAARLGAYDEAAVLVECGVNPNLLLNGKTATEIAEDSGHSELARFLLDKNLSSFSVNPRSNFAVTTHSASAKLP